jgi:signal transduction histidine kinase
VSWRLIALIAIPTVTAMAFGLVRIQEAMKSAASDQRVEQMASLGSSVTRLAFAMEDERDGLAGYIAMGRKGALHTPTGAPTSALNADYARTNAAAAQVTSLSGGITSNSAFPAQVKSDLSAVLDRVADLPHYRSAAVHSLAPSLNIVGDYSEAIADLFTLNDQISQGSSDPTLSNTVRALGALSRTEDEASQQRGILYAALLNGQFEPGAESSLSSALAAQQAELQEFQSAATIGEQQIYSNTVAGPPVDDAQEMEKQAIASGGSGSGSVVVSLPSGLPRSASAAAVWNSDMTATLTDMRKVEQGLVKQIIGQSQSQHSALTRTAIETGIEVLAVLIVVLMITIIVARSMVRPLRKLRTGALEVAGLRLPDAVRRMSETDGEGVSLEVDPIDVNSSDEIGEVARAFDQVHREALRLAANEAALRGNVNAMFVNLSRRSQSLVERQIRLIDSLEQGEQDSKRLASLFQMDHLATRMRRNSENLLVLAGQDLSRRWNRPVALVDVLRAALSEIERYERVTLNVQPGVAVRAQAVSDVVHLTAELVENATSFSAADSPVTIAGHLLGSGGALLEIADQGVGMESDEMAHANWRLDNPPVVDVAVSRRMGLFVVARLAARHGIRVRLRHADSGGLIALVWLPDEAITREGAGGPMPRRRPADSDGSGPWPVVDGTGAGTGDGGRGTVGHEASLARRPRFAPLSSETDMGNSGALPVTGPVSRPGSTWPTTTGPLPAFRDSSAPAAEFETGGGTPPDGTLAAEGWDTTPSPPSSSASDLFSSPAAPDLFSSPAAPDLFSSPAAPDLFSSPAASGPLSSPPASGPLSFPAASGPLSFPAASGPLSSPNSTGPHSSPLDSPRSPSGVVVPPAADAEEQNRLPIFEAVESDWFRHVRRVVNTPNQPQESGNGGWASPADEGWQAAQMVHAPASAGVTPAGLPKRVPKANLVPGTAAAPAVGQAGVAASSVRSAAATRDRFASYQRGVLRGRAAASGTGSDGGEDEASDEA